MKSSVLWEKEHMELFLNAKIKSQEKQVIFF